MSQSLQQKNTRTLLTWLPLVMLAGSIFFYFVMRGHILHTQQQQLRLKQDNIWRAFAESPAVIPRHIRGEYDIIPENTAISDLSEHPRDTTVIFPDAGPVTFDILTIQRSLNGTPYRITTYISSKEFRHLIIKVGFVEVILFVMLLASIVVINRRTSSQLWEPFYATMRSIHSYDIRHDKTPDLTTNTGLEEFDRLNRTMLELIERVNHAYRDQKQFTENASHELQTPLAIIRSKVELLTESVDLNEDSAQLLEEITDANERLSQMNKNLLLLTRIDNGQFPEVAPVALSLLVDRLTHFFREYYENEVSDTTSVIAPGILVAANSALIEILVNNLLRNAYIHNKPGGWVDIRLSDKQLIIQNSGPAPEADPDRLFDRFRKGRTDNRTTGLGLALVRQIAGLYQYDIQYTYREGVHRLQLKFA